MRVPRHRPASRRRGQTATVTALAPGATRGIVKLGGRAFPCALGRSGRRAAKREGDGATPIGCWQLLRVLYRADRIRRPATGLPLRQIRASDGWCDAPADRNYNRPVQHPYPASAEHLWRADGLYDVVVVLSHNAQPRVRGAGSAIFMHVAQPGYRPTAGCIALKRVHLLGLLRGLMPGASVCVRPAGEAAHRGSVASRHRVGRPPPYASSRLQARGSRTAAAPRHPETSPT
jgi:L,D-peptidoglycan transpeptidase YkuD (ErfK/YbiS/YcfS/YnhG family)